MAAAKLTTEEEQRMNECLTNFGAHSLVTDGSKEEKNGKTVYHLVIGDPTTPKSDEVLKDIGKKLKENYDGNAEYYHYGIKIS